MKMVSSAKLHKAQGVIQSMIPYQKKLDSILDKFVSTSAVASKLVSSQNENEKKIEVKKVAVVAFSSNSSLCGAYNSNIIKQLSQVVTSLENGGISGKNVLCYPIGRKIEEASKKMGLNVVSEIEYGENEKFALQTLAANPDYNKIKVLAKLLIDKFLIGIANPSDSEGIQKAVIIYHHFKSPGVQVVEHFDYLPIDLKNYEGESDNRQDGFYNDYIVEPSSEEVLEVLLPQVLIQKLYTCCIDSYASEHAARTIAMQVATDNADDLIQELSLLYNKTRQQAITAELLDIVAGTGK